MGAHKKIVPQQPVKKPFIRHSRTARLTGGVVLELYERDTGQVPLRSQGAVVREGGVLELKSYRREVMKGEILILGPGQLEVDRESRLPAFFASALLLMFAVGLFMLLP